MLERSARTSSAFDAAAWTTNADTLRCDAAAARSSSALSAGPTRIWSRSSLIVDMYSRWQYSRGIVKPSTTREEVMQSIMLDAAGHRRSPATMPGYHRGRPPRNKGEQYPADPPTVEEIVAVMRTVGDRADGHRLRALIVLLWRAGLRISEALALQESDSTRLAARCSSGAGRAASDARSGWTDGPGRSSTRGWRSGASCRSARCCASSTDRPRPSLGGVRSAQATAPRRCRGWRPAAIRPAPARHAHAVEMAHEGVPLVVIQRQLGHANLGITSVYLQGIDSAEIIDTVHGRPSPMISATAGLQLRR